jgi:hypothetical protein
MKYSTELQEKIQYLQDLNKISKPLKREIRKEKIKLFIQQKLFHITLKTILVSILLVFTSILTFNYFIPEEASAINKKSIEKEIEYVYLPDSLKTMNKFLEEIGKVESNNNYKVINKFGYMGKYQIGHTALKTIGFNISTKDFIEMPQLQEVAMLLLLKHNKNTLATYIGKYQHTTINGIYITESGLLAAAHLGGCESVKKFLESNGTEVFKDGNGVPITRYMSRFQGFKIEL